MAFRDCDTRSSVQQPVQQPPRFEYVATRPSALDAAASAAGPGFAIVADVVTVRGIVQWDAERGMPVDEIPAEGWVCS